MGNTPDKNPIDAAAAAWAARCDRDDLSPLEQRELDQWLMQDIRHQGAYARAQAILCQLSRAQAVDATQFTRHSERASPLLTRRSFLWAAASIAGAAAAVGTWMFFGETAYATELGGMLRIPLSDGSVVTLNTSSKLRVRYSSERRVLTLTEGEAYFEVAPDAERKFSVGIGGTVINVAAAKFAVRCSTQQTEVWVQSGHVSVASDNGQAVDLNSNAGCTIGNGQITQLALSTDEINRRLAWRYGNVAFASQTLAQAAQEYARYSHLKIIITDAEVANRRIVGLFSVNDPVGFAEAVGSSLGLKVTVADDGVHIDRIS